jgi:hypothetical protein
MNGHSNGAPFLLLILQYEIQAIGLRLTDQSTEITLQQAKAINHPVSVDCPRFPFYTRSSWVTRTSKARFNAQDVSQETQGVLQESAAPCITALGFERSNECAPSVREFLVHLCCSGGNRLQWCPEGTVCKAGRDYRCG